MSVVNLVILLESVACALVHVAWEADDVEAQVLDAAGVQAMGVGVIVLVIALAGEDLLGVAAYHLAAEATAGRLHIVAVSVIHLMLMG
ncbi:hypothetical protein RJ639_000285, partial [Escallonia herrerae]